MSENPIAVAKLNDFIFCPVSIYFHGLEENDERILFQDTHQINGTAAHEKTDMGTYSSKRSVLQGISVYCEKYNLSGKIDMFNADTGILTERKKKIKTIYDGYVFQLYAQYFSLIEMGYDVKEMRLYSMDDNKVYKVKMPGEDTETFEKFEKTVCDMNTFSLEDFVQKNRLKCEKCIYEPLCSFSCLKGEC